MPVHASTPLEPPPGTAFIAFDPGLRIGVAWVDAAGALLRRAILGGAEVDALPLPPGVGLLVGDGTGSAALVARLVAHGGAPEVVDERGTTLEARRLYFADHPARGWRRLLPPGMRSPPGPIDDYAAYAIARRRLGLEPSARRRG